jgi:hypothetical protein
MAISVPLPVLLPVAACAGVAFFFLVLNGWFGVAEAFTLKKQGDPMTKQESFRQGVFGALGLVCVAVAVFVLWPSDNSGGSLAPKVSPAKFAIDEERTTLGVEADETAPPSRCPQTITVLGSIAVTAPGDVAYVWVYRPRGMKGPPQTNGDVQKLHFDAAGAQPISNAETVNATSGKEKPFVAVRFLTPKHRELTATFKRICT